MKVRPPFAFSVGESLGRLGDESAGFGGRVDLVEMTLLIEVLKPQRRHQLAAGAQQRVVGEVVDEPPDIDGKAV